MASRTQIRLEQLTGSVVDIKSQALAATANNNFEKGTAAALTGSSVADLFGYMGSALNRIHGAASSEPFNNTAGHFLNAAATDGSDDGGAIKLSASAGGIGLAWADNKNLWAEGGKIMMVANENDANAIKLHADAGDTQAITLLNDAGEAETAITITSTAGGVDIDAAAAKNVDISGGQVLISSKDDAGSAIALTANQGTSETILVTNTQGTAAGAISLVATAGGVLIDQDSATKKVHVDSEGAVDVDAVKGITITNAAGAAGDDITIENTNAENASVIITAAGNGTGDGAIQIATTNAAGEITITSAHTAGRALHIDANTNAGSIVDIDAGILDIDVTGVASLDSGGTLSLGVANSGVAVNIGHATSEVTIGDNLTVTGDTTLAGDLIVQGATTTVSSSNMVIQDSIIGLGFSGSDDAGNIFGNAGQRAVVFGKSANQHDFLPALNYDGTGFVLGTFNASPSSASMGAAQAGIELRAGHLKPISSDGATLGDANEMWSDLFLANGGVINFNNGNFKLTHTANALTIDTSDKLQFRDTNAFIHSNDANDLLAAATDITLDAGNNITLDADGANVFLDDGGTRFGLLSNGGESNGLILSSSAGKMLTIDSNLGAIQLSQDVVGGGTNGAILNLGSQNVQIEQLGFDPGPGHVAFKFAHNDTYGSQFLQISGSLRLYKANKGDRYVGIDVNNPGTNYNLTLPDAVPGTANEILVSDTSGNLSFATQAELGIGSAASKGVKVITSTVSAGTAVNFNSVDAGDTISGLSQASSQGASVDLYVNGQLLISGSAAERGSGTRDYDIEATGTTVKFAFDLEPDDVVQLIKR